MNAIRGKDGEDVGMRLEHPLKPVEAAFEFSTCVARQNVFSS
jgi:hypothetical protein